MIRPFSFLSCQFPRPSDKNYHTCALRGVPLDATELFKLSYENIDFDAKIIFVRSSKKGGIKFRQIPIHKDFYQILKSWAEADNSPGGPVIHWRRKPVQSIDSAFRTAKKKAGITRRLRPYDFRHAFASRIFRDQGDLKSTSQMLGHTELYLKVVFKGKGGVSTGRLLAAVNRPH